MEDPFRKLKHKTRPEAELLGEQQHQHQQSAREFASVEDLLRHDAAHTTVPPAVAERVRDSIAREAPAPKPWWQRLFRS